VPSWCNAYKLLYFSLDCVVLVAAIKKQEEITVFVQRIESLKAELEIEQQQGASLRQKLEEATKVEQEKNKLQKEVK
jgi:hypothetical protein